MKRKEIGLRSFCSSVVCSLSFGVSHGEELAVWDFQVSGDSAAVLSASVGATPVVLGPGVAQTQDSTSGGWRTRGYSGSSGYVEFSITAGEFEQLTLESLIFGAFARAANSSGGAWDNPEIILEYSMDSSYATVVAAGVLDLGVSLVEGSGEGLTFTADETTFFSSDLVISPGETYYFRLRSATATGSNASRNQLYFDVATDLTLNGTRAIALPDLVWSGGVGDAWNLLDANFTSNGISSLFKTGDDVAIITSTDLVVDSAGVTAGEVVVDSDSGTFELQGGLLTATALLKAGSSNFELVGAVDTEDGDTIVLGGSLQVDGGALSTSEVKLGSRGQLRVENGGTLDIDSDLVTLVDAGGGEIRVNSNTSVQIGGVQTEVAGAAFLKGGTGSLTISEGFGSAEAPIYLDYNGGDLIFDTSELVSLIDNGNFSSVFDGLFFRGSYVLFNGLQLGRNSAVLSDDRIGVIYIQGEDTVVASGQDTGDNSILVTVQLDSDLEVFCPAGDNDFYFDFPVVGSGGLSKTGDGNVFLNAENSYTGDTDISAGTMTFFEPSLADESVVSLSGTGTLILDFASDPVEVDTVGQLVIDREVMAPGLWGGLDSSATFKSARLGGVGLLLVTGAGGDYESWAESFGVTGGAGDDDDQDGVSNETEYAFGTDPTAAGSVSPYTDLEGLASGSLTYTRRLSALTDLDYTYGYATTLGDGFLPFTPVEVSDGGDPIENITLTLPGALLEEETLFIQISAE